ncbi:MAG: 4Fe-4S dicluster domain-containing protein [Caldisericia bacterium]|jgi:heterodisulfide reductase subunit C|nr:4Fe-4S dicluster domain-containing protein [Caldisericia bacterium]HOW02828.1 4Fe-4S dicluster domain-containing protein [Caldisericia bacterium]HQG81922.1 4Fe-4S dicluster domain-containing protein [Caldisericia bacterium]
MSKVITFKDLDPHFKYEIMKEKGGEKIVNCFACNTCTLSCPVRAVDDEYNPRSIIRLSLLGAKDEVLSSSFIWLCSSCYLCYERCPQDVRITDLMDAIKNIAARCGFVPETFKGQIELLKKHGRLYEVGDFENKKRAKLGLPEIKEEASQVEKIIEITGASKFLEKNGVKNE